MSESITKSAEHGRAALVRWVGVEERMPAADVMVLLGFADEVGGAVMTASWDAESECWRDGETNPIEAPQWWAKLPGVPAR